MHIAIRNPIPGINVRNDSAPLKPALLKIFQKAKTGKMQNTITKMTQRTQPIAITPAVAAAAASGSIERH